MSQYQLEFEYALQLLSLADTNRYVRASGNDTWRIGCREQLQAWIRPFRIVLPEVKEEK